MTDTPLDMLTAYVRAFETLGPEAVVPFYELPCTFIRPDGLWVVQEQSTALGLAAHLVEHSKSQGYRRTAVSGVTMRTLAPGLVELGGVFLRDDAADAEIARFGFTYIVRGGSDGWRIVVAVAHDASTETMAVPPATTD